jgi:monoamine oxidase
VTLPLGVLQAPAGAPGAVAFDPPLPAAKQEALALLRAGAVARLTLRFRERFWVRGPDDPLTRLGFAYAPSPWFPVFWTSYPVVSPLLVAWSGGPAAAELARLTEADRLGHALDALARLFDRSRVELEALLEGWHEHDWLADPYSRGAYSYAAVGGADAPAALGAPVGGRLFFAGEATVADGDIGTVHGALRSGSRSAAELLVAARSAPEPR